MKSGCRLWNELCFRYQLGVDSVRQMQKSWESVKTKVDEERFAKVQGFLVVQEKEAKWWCDVCIQYFQTFSKLPIPVYVDKPEKNLEYYRKNVPVFTSAAK
jgi:alpha-glucuronidase